MQTVVFYNFENYKIETCVGVCCTINFELLYKMILISDILNTVNYEKFIGDKNHAISNIISIKDFAYVEDQSQVVTWCSIKNQQMLKEIHAGTIICDRDTNTEYLNLNSCNYLFVENPRKVFKQILEHFFVEHEVDYTIQKSAFIDPSVQLGPNVKIGHNVVIEKNVVIGDYTEINHNTVILSNTVIGNHVKIGCNCTIGSNGFGYENNEKGENEFIPHIGNVIIADHVVIGNNNTIDRAVLGSTVINEFVKTDNLVHIGHGVKIGRNTLIAASATFSGSVTMGENVWVSPAPTIINDIKIGDNALLGLGTVVIKNVEQGKTIVGNPGKEIVKK